MKVNSVVLEGSKVIVLDDLEYGTFFREINKKSIYVKCDPNEYHVKIVDSDDDVLVFNLTFLTLGYVLSDVEVEVLDIVAPLELEVLS